MVEEILGDDAVTGVRLRNVKTDETSEFPTDGVFIAIGHTPNTALFEGQLELDDAATSSCTSRRTTTSVPGVFAAGDVTDTIYRQAVTAAGQGCKAAIDAERVPRGREHALTESPPTWACSENLKERPQRPDRTNEEERDDMAKIGDVTDAGVRDDRPRLGDPRARGLLGRVVRAVPHGLARSSRRSARRRATR